jgi:lysyl-tRNA synthetase, class II
VGAFHHPCIHSSNLPSPSIFRYYTGAEDFVGLSERIKRGDVIGITGHPSRSKTGELSVVPTEIRVLTPCLRIIPTSHFGLKDVETR